MSLGKFVWLQVRKHQDCACIYFHGVAYKSAHMGQAPDCNSEHPLRRVGWGPGVLRDPCSEDPVILSVTQPRPGSGSPAPWGGVGLSCEELSSWDLAPQQHPELWMDSANLRGFHVWPCPWTGCITQLDKWLHPLSLMLPILEVEVIVNTW